MPEGAVGERECDRISPLCTSAQYVAAHVLKCNYQKYGTPESSHFKLPHLLPLCFFRGWGGMGYKGLL